MILVTRPEPAASATADRLRSLGHSPLVAPMLVITPRALGPVPPVQAVLVTSGNALPTLPDSLRALPLFAVGDATASLARAAGFWRVVSANGDAVALADVVRDHLRPAAGSVLLASGARQGWKLAAMLRAAGFGVIRRVAYAALPVRSFPAPAAEAIGGGRVRAAIFLSAETATVFRRRLPDDLRPALSRIDALAMAPGIADRLHPLPWQRVLVSGAQTLEKVLALL